MAFDGVLAGAQFSPGEVDAATWLSEPEVSPRQDAAHCPLPKQQHSQGSSRSHHYQEHKMTHIKCRVGNSLFCSFFLLLCCSSLLRSKLLILKSSCEQFALIALATVSELVLSLFNLSGRDQIAPVAFYKKVIMSEIAQRSFFESNSHFCSQKTSDSLEK